MLFRSSDLADAAAAGAIGSQRLRIFSFIGWLLILGSALLMVVRMIWAAEPYSAWSTDSAGNDVIADGFFYRPLGGSLSGYIAQTMLVVGVGLRGLAVSRRYRWVGVPLAIVLTWSLWFTLVVTTSILIRQLRLDPDVWGWWVTLSDMFYEGGVTSGVLLAATALVASLAAIELVRAGARVLERRGIPADRVQRQ